jgi:hypothetical protein
MRMIEVELTAGGPARDRLSGLLQAGFAVPSRAGLTLREFMRETLRFPDGYIETAVSTVFLDGKPVDDIDAATVAEGSLVALSAAMPGLLGAMMRRNSPYASLRESISFDPAAPAAGEPARGKACRVWVRLFNAVMRERGSDLLSRGIIVPADAAFRALEGRRLEVGETTTEERREGDDNRVFLRISLATDEE